VGTFQKPLPFIPGANECIRIKHEVGSSRLFNIFIALKKESGYVTSLLKKPAHQVWPIMTLKRIQIRFFYLIILFTLLILHGCFSFYRGEPAGQHETKRMLVTAYDAGQKSTGWRHKYGCFLFPPVYAYGPNEGKRSA
jgi:hypothetical protein